MTPTPAQVLATPMLANDANAATIRDYLISLLDVVWTLGPDFSGKRPFGNSSWQYEIYAALVHAELIPGAFDEDGYLDDCDTDAGDELIGAAIESLRAAP